MQWGNLINIDWASLGVARISDNYAHPLPKAKAQLIDREGRGTREIGILVVNAQVENLRSEGQRLSLPVAPEN